jgi:hypothetical protein
MTNSPEVCVIVTDTFRSTCRLMVCVVDGVRGFSYNLCYYEPALPAASMATDSASLVSCTMSSTNSSRLTWAA